MLATCSTKLGDDAGYTYAQDKFLTYYPSKDLWADAIRRVESKPGFPDRLRLDVLRLRRATGTFEGANAYMAMAQLAISMLLTSFIIWPCPGSWPMKKTLRAKQSSKGRTSSTCAGSPAAITVSVPAVAPGTPPIGHCFDAGLISCTNSVHANLSGKLAGIAAALPGVSSCDTTMPDGTSGADGYGEAVWASLTDGTRQLTARTIEHDSALRTCMEDS